MKHITPGSTMSHYQTIAYRGSLKGGEKFLRGPFWLLLSKTIQGLSESLYLCFDVTFIEAVHWVVVLIL